MNLLRPDMRARAIEDIDLDVLESKGVEGIFLDVDNTLAPHNFADPTDGARLFIANARKRGVKLCLISNNSRQRVETLNRTLGLPFISRACKPLGFSFFRALRQMKLRPGQAAVAGDQIFSDILGGNMAGIFTIFVNPICPGKDEGLFIRFKRRLEGKSLRNCPYCHQKTGN